VPTGQANGAVPPATGSGKRGAPKGNKNALRNGSKLNAHRLVVGELPMTMVMVKREACAYRRNLEAEVLSIKGSINATDAHLIDTAAAATIQAGVCRWLLRHKVEQMSVSDIRGCTADIVKAKERRDAAVKALQLNVKPVEPWAVVIDAPANGEAHD
jgi:hypothetical protein